MSLPDTAPPRKFRRLGLWLPFVVAGVALLAWSGVWFWARGQAEKRMDAAVADLARAGYPMTWKARKLSGYPFRLDVSLTEARVREPSGWALDIPLLEAEAEMITPGHWMLAAPQGLTFTRPVGGPVAVSGETLRASLRDLDKRPPSFSFQGVKLAFAPAAGAQSYFLTTAEKVEFHLRPGPDDEGGVFLKLDGGKARAPGLFAQVAGDKPIAIEWNSTLSKMSTFAGSDWPVAVRAWNDAGGRMTVRRAGLTAGDATIGASGGTLGVGADGRLRGTLDLSLRQAPRVLAAMGETGVIPVETAQVAAAVAQARQAGDETRANLTFEAGRTTLGPVALGGAPKVYERR